MQLGALAKCNGTMGRVNPIIRARSASGERLEGEKRVKIRERKEAKTQRFNMSSYTLESISKKALKFSRSVIHDSVALR